MGGGTINPVDRLVAFFSPMQGMRRAQARQALAYYEGARPGPQKKFHKAGASPEQLVQASAGALRNQMRHLERNHDITRGALNVLVTNTVGPQGIGVEFQPRRLDGTIHTEYAQALNEAFAAFSVRPEVTRGHSWGSMCRLAARTHFRDGEVFGQLLSGPVPGLVHGSQVPFSVELIEPDLLPLDYDDVAKGIRQAIQRNAWNRSTGYWVHKSHPDDSYSARGFGDLKFVTADNMLHLRSTDRIGQLRGVTCFASVIGRIGDIKDYEESERVAAKIAAMLTGYVKRQAPDGGGYEGPKLDADGSQSPRQLSLAPGMIIDTLAVGEEIGLIDSSRPNPNLVTFRNGQLRAFAAGISASYSSVSRNYDGTYSSQRQEMVEQWVNYACMTDDFVGQWARPIVERFRLTAELSGVVRRPPGVKPGTEDDVLFIAPSMPWIDPLKEATAWLQLCQAGFASEVEVIRRRGGNPAATLQQIAEHRRKAAELGVRLSTEPPVGGAPQDPAGQKGPAKDDDDEGPPK